MLRLNDINTYQQSTFCRSDSNSTLNNRMRQSSAHARQPRRSLRNLKEEPEPPVVVNKCIFSSSFVELRIINAGVWYCFIPGKIICHTAYNSDVDDDDDDVMR